MVMNRFILRRFKLESTASYIALYEAVIHQAERDVENMKKKGKDHEHWGRDALVFLNSDYYEEMLYIINWWYHRRNDTPHISYNE